MIKRFSYTETGYAAVVVGLLLGCVLWLASLLGLFATLDGVMYDHLLGGAAASAHKQPKVMLLEVEPELRDAGDEVWLPLIKELQTQGAAQVVFTFMPPSVSKDFYFTIHQTGKAIFGRRLLSPVGASLDAPVMEPLPPSAQGLGLTMAAYAIAPSEYGVHRRQAYAFLSDGQHQFASLEGMAATHSAELAGTKLEKRPFLVNFLGGAASLPRISAQRVLKGELIPELVNGRSVLIGVSDSGPYLFTPLAVSGKLLSELEFHGFALDTLLRDQVVRSVPLWLQFPLILFLVGVSLFMFQWGAGVRFTSGLTVILVVVYALLAWLALHYARIWLPLVELWAVQIASYLMFTRYRAANEETTLRRMLLETNAKLRQRFFPASFTTSQEHWSQVISMVNQTLNLERVIFLERVKGDHRVREVKSLNCGLQDIKELRRDYERPPYSTAIAERHPIEVQNYLSHGQDGEVQYLIPLLFGGEVLGFWAFGARPEKLAALHNREAVLRDFAEQIAELLFHRQQALDKEAKSSRPLQRYLRLQGGEQLTESLNKTLVALDRRLGGMEEYLDGLGTASILYDLFGQVRIANRQMVLLLSEAKLLPYQMTATDLIGALADVSLDYARGVMQAIILDRQKISLPAKLADDSRSYMLHLGPLLPTRGKQILREGDPLPFEVEGILCELVDTTMVKRLYSIKDEVMERVAYQIRNDTESLLSGISLLETGDLAEDKQSRVISIIRDKISNLVAVTEQVNGLLNQEVDTGVVECYPIDCRRPLLAAVEAIRDKAAVHGVVFDLQLPDLVSLVFASPEGLQDVLDSVLAVLVADTIQQGSILASLEEREGWITYRFANQGFGIPEDRLQSYLHGDSSQATDEFGKLQQSAMRVAYWEGRLEGHSEIGVGTRFELKLKGFI
ncbi:MAG: CHASE2 domain-containing protein [Sulfuricellaceae bacterium]|nr:CHASE2 domain-containing protein [Sulfuricellaceae bacterium]